MSDGLRDLLPLALMVAVCAVVYALTPQHPVAAGLLAAVAAVAGTGWLTTGSGE